MKLLVCLFLVVVILEEYNCAPYTRRGYPRRHHHGLQHQTSRQRSPYRSSYRPWEARYPSMKNMHHPLRYSRHCRWSSSRHCTVYLHPHRHQFRSGYGFPRRHQFASGHEYRYGPRTFTPDTTPMSKTEDKLSTITQPNDNLVENITAKLVDKSTKNIVDKSTEQPLNMLLKKQVEGSIEKTTQTIIEYAAIPVMKPEDKPQDVTKMSIDKLEAKPTTTTDSEVIIAKMSEDMTVRRDIEKPVQISMVKPTLATTDSEDIAVKMSEDMTIRRETEKPVEMSTVKSTLATTDSEVKMSEDMTVKKETEKSVEKSTVKPTLATAESAASTVMLSEVIPQDIPMTLANNQMPYDKSSGISVEPVDKPVEKRLEFSDPFLVPPSTNSLKTSREQLADYSTVYPFDDGLSENLSDMTTENIFSEIKIN